ncbi:MAG: DNA primase [Clostridia bacterium]|nr:DNA primase [Clostridia bacterium]
MFFEEEYLQEVKEKNDIVDIISGYVSLRRSGNRYLGLCPFHSEKTPSFFVNPAMQLYHCFGCGAGGTVIHFIEQMENLDFVEAVKFLAQRAGIPLPEEKHEVSDYTRLKRNIREMNKIAGRTYFRQLISEAGREALSYLRGRGLSDDTIKTYGLGYAPNRWDFMYRTLKENGFSDYDIVKSGLCIEKNGKIFDFFRDRVMFPVMDLRGNVIAFGGRVMGDGMPKYLNTGETPVFSKRQNLFSLHLAKNTSEDYLILAEGYMDVIALYQAGFQNAVASLGTAFCEDHARLLKRFTGRVIISFDGDGAGQAATKKAVDILKRDGIQVRVLKITGAKDPDELIKKFGPEAYGEAIRNALSGVDYELSSIYPPGGFSDDEERIEYTKKAVGILKNIHNKLELEVYAKKVAELVNISYDSVLAQIKQAQKKRRFETPVDAAEMAFIRKKSVSQSLVKLIVENPSYFGKIREKIKPQYFKEELHKKLYHIFTEFTDQMKKPDISMLIERLEPDEAKQASEMFMEREPYLDYFIYLDSLINKLENEAEPLIFSEDDRDDMQKLLEYTQKLRQKNDKN